MASYNLFFLSILSIAFFNEQIFQAKGDTSLILKTCKSTKYYDLCVSSLKSDSTSPNADTRGLASIMVRVGVANATATTTYLSSQLLTAANDTMTKTVVKDCADKYSYAADALRGSLQDLGAEAYDYAYVRVTAAADYPNACRNAFKPYPALAYPPELAVKGDGLKRICVVVLGIIDTIGW